MSQSMEGPFSEKLKTAVQGRAFPAAAPEAAAAADFDLSLGGKSSREKRRTKHEKKERTKREGNESGVSGRAVHMRGQFAESVPIESSIESVEQQELKRLFSDVVSQATALTQLNAFMEAAGYVDAEGALGQSITAELERANQLVRQYFESEEEKSPLESDIEVLRSIQEQFTLDIADVKEAIEGIESAGQLVVPAEIKGLLDSVKSSNERDSDVNEPSVVETRSRDESVDPSQSSAERRPYTSFDRRELDPRGLREIWYRKSPSEQIAMVSDQLNEWQTFDQAIRKFGDEGRFRDDLKARGLGDRYDKILRLTGRSVEVASRIKGIQKEFEKKGELDQEGAAFLKAIFFGYHELLVVAEGIIRERERETPIVEAEKEDRKKKAAAEKEAIAKKAEEVRAAAQKVEPIASQEEEAPFEEKLSRLTDLLEQWNALGTEFGWRTLRAAIKKERKEKIPAIKDLEEWLAKKTTPGSWNAGDKEYINQGVLPEMELLIRQATAAVEKLRAERAEESVASNVTVLRTGRPIVGEHQMTEWERMDPAEQNRLRALLFERRDEYFSRANALLKKSGVDRAVDRQKFVRERMEVFMMKVIEKELAGVTLTDSDRASLMRELNKETEAFFAQ